MTTQHAKSNAREGDGVAEAVSALSRLHARLVRNLEIDALLGDMAHSLRSAAEITALAQAIAAMQAQQGAEPVAAEMKQLLHSTHEIALRGGADTNWEGLAKSIAKLGIAPITARHYFAEGTPREAISKHLDALLAHVNAERTGAPP